MFHVEHLVKASESELMTLLRRGAEVLGVTLSEEAVSRFMEYLKELKAWNRKVNLTAIEEEREIVIRHFLDSLTPCAFLEKAESLLDIGAGGGFPGIPLKIATPSMYVCLIDSVSKKVHFMRHVIRKLGLVGIDAESIRAEDLGFIEKNRGKFDVVTSRAFTELKGFVEVALPYLRPNGRIVAIKGPTVVEEIAPLKNFPGIAGIKTHKVKIPFSKRETTIVVIRKAD
ncbi:MAG: 16S rRNA (guanine(527)-N(7))-methyltransferase RsmG [Deltaproteobacteria bacterium]|nr:16S rRNA (guanine(527)-N(7))-methyltransferase RsmG [Deltaproteobacteria bacterium]